MRERPFQQYCENNHSRITPARAGKTPPQIGHYPLWGDHPRSCGKDRLRVYSTSAIRGSPPLVRERPRVSLRHRAKRGITPARAGKTILPIYTRSKIQDHPRSCGKDSNGFLYFRPFTLTDIQNLFNFFAKHLTSSASPNAR